MEGDREISGKIETVTEKAENVGGDCICQDMLLLLMLMLRLQKEKEKGRTENGISQGSKPADSFVALLLFSLPLHLPAPEIT